MSILTRSPVARAAPSEAHSFRALVRRGVRDRRRASLSLGGSLGAMCALVVAVWPSIEHSINNVVKNYPKGLKQAFGIDQLSTAESYLHAEMFSLIVPLAVAFLAVRSIAGALASAEERHYLDSLLSAPVSRRALAASSFAAAALVVAGALITTGAIAWVAGAVAGAGLGAGALAAGLVSVWALALLFAGVAVLATGLLRSSTAVTGVATGLLVAMYVIDLLGKLAKPLEPLRWASAFKYFAAQLRDGIDPLACAGLAVVGIALAAAGALLFERRDVL